MLETQQPKPFSVYKHGHYNPNGWKTKNICNAFFKGGKPARRCPQYQTRCNRLTEVINKIQSSDSEYDQTWKTSPSFLDSTIPKSFLRRNTVKVRLTRPYYNDKRNKFIDMLQTNPKLIRTQKYKERVKFSAHLEQYHGFGWF